MANLVIATRIMEAASGSSVRVMRFACERMIT